MSGGLLVSGSSKVFGRMHCVCNNKTCVISSFLTRDFMIYTTNVILSEMIIKDGLGKKRLDGLTKFFMKNINESVLMMHKYPKRMCMNKNF